MLRLMLSCCLVSIVSGTGIFAVESSLLRGRIVGGTTAIQGQFPYTASLKTALQQNHFCGGFIITDQWLGTAAHCTIGRLTYSFVAVVGAVSRTSGGTTVSVVKFVNHPEYDDKDLKNDIALVKTTKIEFSATVHPIILGAETVNGGMFAAISGFGYTSYPGNAASNLQWAIVKTTSNEECRQQLSKSNAAKVYDHSICAESVDIGGACMGDSGGPLVGIDNVLIGIISWGVPCSKGFPDVYTRITSFHDWIDSVIDF